MVLGNKLISVASVTILILGSCLGNAPSANNGNKPGKDGDSSVAALRGFGKGNVQQGVLRSWKSGNGKAVKRKSREKPPNLRNAFGDLVKSDTDKIGSNLSPKRPDTLVPESAVNKTNNKTNSGSFADSSTTANATSKDTRLKAAQDSGGENSGEEDCSEEESTSSVETSGETIENGSDSEDEIDSDEYDCEYSDEKKGYSNLTRLERWKLLLHGLEEKEEIILFPEETGLALPLGYRAEYRSIWSSEDFESIKCRWVFYGNADVENDGCSIKMASDGIAVTGGIFSRQRVTPSDNWRIELTFRRQFSCDCETDSRGGFGIYMFENKTSGRLTDMWSSIRSGQRTDGFGLWVSDNDLAEGYFSGPFNNFGLNRNGNLSCEIANPEGWNRLILQSVDNLVELAIEDLEGEDNVLYSEHLMNITGITSIRNKVIGIEFALGNCSEAITIEDLRFFVLREGSCEEPCDEEEYSGSSECDETVESCEKSVSAESADEDCSKEATDDSEEECSEDISQQPEEEECLEEEEASGSGSVVEEDCSEDYETDDEDDNCSEEDESGSSEDWEQSEEECSEEEDASGSGSGSGSVVEEDCSEDDEIDDEDENRSEEIDHENVAENGDCSEESADESEEYSDISKEITSPDSNLKNNKTIGGKGDSHRKDEDSQINASNHESKANIRPNDPSSSSTLGVR